MPGVTPRRACPRASRGRLTGLTRGRTHASGGASAELPNPHEDAQFALSTTLERADWNALIIGRYLREARFDLKSRPGDALRLRGSASVTAVADWVPCNRRCRRIATGTRHALEQDTCEEDSGLVILLRTKNGERGSPKPGTVGGKFQNRLRSSSHAAPSSFGGITLQGVCQRFGMLAQLVSWDESLGVFS